MSGSDGLEEGSGSYEAGLPHAAAGRRAAARRSSRADVRNVHRSRQRPCTPHEVRETRRRWHGRAHETDKLEAEKKGATDDRAARHAEYLKGSQDYAEPVDALVRAIQMLSTQVVDRAQADSLLQKMAQTVTGTPRVLAVLLQQQDLATSSSHRGAGPGTADLCSAGCALMRRQESAECVQEIVALQRNAQKLRQEVSSWREEPAAVQLPQLLWRPR